MGHVEMSKAARDRINVLVVRGNHHRQGKLLYWSSKRGRAKVLLPSGAVITVGTDTVVPLNEGNIVADEISVDTQYPDFRGLRTDVGQTTGEVMPTVGTSAGNTQPRLERRNNVSHHVA